MAGFVIAPLKTIARGSAVGLFHRSLGPVLASCGWPLTFG